MYYNTLILQKIWTTDQIKNSTKFRTFRF